jgi:hypothetical protein
MTSEERIRMNESCARIQDETDYNKFVKSLREMAELIERKEHRRFQDQPKFVWNRIKPWKSVAARAGKVLPSLNSQTGRVEISIPGAEDLFREIRLQNVFNTVDGQAVALTNGAQLTITFEAEIAGTVPTNP